MGQEAQLEGSDRALSVLWSLDVPLKATGSTDGVKWGKRVL